MITDRKKNYSDGISVDLARRNSDENLPNDIVTEPAPSRDRELFELAFDLAYFIHGNKEIAFFIAEDALDGLSSLLGYQKKNRTPSNRLRGFWKWGERTRPIRKTLILNEDQMLQWLVYKESQSWEQQTERGQGFYSPTKEDLIIRYVEQLIFLTARRGSFYITLAISSLLHQLDRRETRLFYDVLTQSDPARMKDTNYIGKQRIELLDKIRHRFKAVVEKTSKSGMEKQSVLEPANQSNTNLVYESLRRFTPWGTTCVIGPAFDVTDIPKLYFSGTGVNDEDEDVLEMNRIHTVLDPDCFEQFAKGLQEYARSLPDSDLDSNCKFDSVNKRLMVPRFVDLQGGPPRDRYEVPKLRSADYVRLQRTLESRGHRKKAFVPQTLTVYADGTSVFSFEAKSRIGKCSVSTAASFIEVRGHDANGEVKLATLPLGGLRFSEEEFEDSIIHGDRELVIKLRTCPNDNASESTLQLEVAYNLTPERAMQLAQRFVVKLKQITKSLKYSTTEAPGFGVRLIQVGLISVLVGIVAVLIFRFHSRPESNKGETKIASTAPTTVNSAPSPPTVETRPKQLVPKSDNTAIAQARWTSDPNAALKAVSIELARSETLELDFPQPRTNLIISVPFYDVAGQAYPRYRMSILAANHQLWRRTIVAPSTSATRYTHILEISLFTQRIEYHTVYDLRVDGWANDKWQHIGRAILKRN